MKILIVDDKLENVYLLESLLNGIGYNTVTAKNGAEALTLALKAPPNLIISDILMPVMDGFTFCHECKKNELLNNIPFVFYSATYTSRKDEEFALSLGADRFILKPQDPDVFVEIIKSVLNDVKDKKYIPYSVPDLQEKVILQEYNSTLIRKLEDKISQVEKAENELKRINAELKKEIEEHKCAKEKAEKSDKLKTEFLAQVSHEIRSPMNVIMNFSRIVKEEVSNKSFEGLPVLFNGIELSSQRIIRTIELILNMSEMQVGTYEPSWKNIDLVNDVLNVMQNEFTFIAQRKGLELNFSYPKEETIIKGDQYSINQIFVNLFDNALKYTEKGKIDVLISKDNSNKTEVIIEDTGIGISEEFMTKMFEPFMQEEQGYSRSYEGNGLGLALVKKYCDMNEIKISTKSKKGKGTRFTLTFSK